MDKQAKPTSSKENGVPSIGGAKPKQKKVNDRVVQGQIVTRPKEHEADQKTRPPDATIVVDGQKYQVRKKGKAKPTTEDGLYHNKNKPAASRKKLEKALLAWAVVALIAVNYVHPLEAGNITQWNLWDNTSEVNVHSAMFKRNITRSLHGIWPDKICKGVPTPMAKDYELEQIVGMVDASEATNFTCCRLQRHEWNKHGWCNWINLDPWIKIMNDTQRNLTNFQNQTECAVICRHDNLTDLNIVLQARSEPTFLTGCKHGKNYSFSGDIRDKPCNIDLSTEDLLKIRCREASQFGETLIDDFTEVVEVGRRYGFKALNWAEKSIKKVKKKLFGAQANPYCPIKEVIFDIVYTDNCTPKGLPPGTKIIGPGRFDMSVQDNKRLIPKLPYHISDMIILSLIAMSDFVPETSCIVYLVLHYGIPRTDQRRILTDLDENQLNLTSETKVDTVVPGSIWLGNQLVCIKPGWWPYSAEVTALIGGIFTVADLFVKTIEEIIGLWTEATAIAFLAALIKIFRGQPIQAIAWLVILGGAQAEHIECNPNFIYALARNTSMGVLGPLALTTMWYSGAKDTVLNDGILAARCTGAGWLVTPKCKYSVERYLAINHPSALKTTTWFKQLAGMREIPREELMTETKRGYLCPCNSTPVIRSEVEFNPFKINGPALQLTCPFGWKGFIECTTTSQDTLITTTIYTFKRFKPYGREKYCTTTKVENDRRYSCIYGGNDTCVKGSQVKGSQSDSVEYCDWCGFRFKGPEHLKKYPLGECKKIGITGKMLYHQENCCANGTCISKEGTVECLIGNTRVKVKLENKSLRGMPCRPIIHKSYGQPNPKYCTFRWAYTLENKYYEPRDDYYQQYIVKGGYQYWFDLNSSDHVSDWLTRYFPIIVVALLGGRAVLWVLIAYYILTSEWVSADEGTILSADALAMGNILMTRDMSVMLCYLMLLVVTANSRSRRFFTLLFHWLTVHPLQSLLLTFVYIVGYVRAEDPEGISDSAWSFHIVFIMLFFIYHIISTRDYNLTLILLVVIGLKSVDYIQVGLFEIPLLISLFSIIITMYVFSSQVKFRPVLLILSIVSLVALLRCLYLISYIQLPKVTIPWSWFDPRTIVLLYLFITSISVTQHIDYAKPFLVIGPYVLSYIVLWVDVITLLVFLPWFELVKVYYLKRKKDHTEGYFTNGGLTTEELSPFDQDFTIPTEGVHFLPSRGKTKTISLLSMTLIRSIILTSVSSVWRPILFFELVIEAVYWAHLKVVKELSGSTRFVGRLVASIIEMNWALDHGEVAAHKKFLSLSSKIRQLMIKHKVQNESMKKWFEDEELFRLPKVVYTLRASTLSGSPDSILCSVCEAKENRQMKKPCPKCGNKGTKLKCGLTLAEFEEEHYKKIYILEDGSQGPFREEERKVLTYRAKGYLFLRNLPILASKNKYLLVGNLGYELSDLEALGWIIRGPAVCKKIVNHERCRPSIPDKLTSFFGIMPRGTTPRAPTRFPNSLIKIKRGFETGWAYTHPGGISSVTHVTQGLDLYVNDSFGRTRVICQDKNTLTDECEYGIKTDSGCQEGARCYVINPEATNIAGTKGAMVHLRKTGGEYTCVTAQGTPAFYNLKNLRGWSGLPIFEAATGKIVGRVKAGKNVEENPTIIMSGSQTARPNECDFSIVKKLEAMNRGDFKQVTLATGAGKTTELPKRLIETIGRHKRILVLIPLRAAAEGVYNYMKVKHPSISFNLRIGDLKEGDMATGITYASYGYFCQMDMPRLETAIKSYSYIFLDEYHCATAEQLAVISKIHRFSEQVRVIAMTATPAGSVSTVGQKHTIEEVVVPEIMRGEDLGADHIEVAGLKIQKKELDNNVLTFVPTKKLATETAKKLKAQGYNAGYYFSGEDPSSLRTIVSKTPYIIVATNAIESGVTLPDLDTVIDTGMKCEKRLRIDSTPPFIVTGLKRMAITNGEQAQRKGRVGRTKPGRYLRGPANVGGEKDYHYELLQAQRYGLQDSINITKSFREMNYDWSLYEQDPLRIAQLEILNTLVISQDLPIITKNMMTRTTHPEPIQLAYNSIETPVPVLFPKVVNGEVTDKYETFELMTCRKLGKDVPVYLYATEDEDLVIDMLDLKWPDVTEKLALETMEALKQVTGLSKGETALLIALLGWVGYEALVKRHIPIVTDIYTIADEKLEDTTHLQYAPDELSNPDTIEMKDLSSHQVGKIIGDCGDYIKQAFSFLRIQADNIKSSPSYDKVTTEGKSLIIKLLDYLKENEGDIKRYGLWGIHTSLYNSIKERLGHETAFTTLVLKWVAFTGKDVPTIIKQAAVDLVVFYLFNRPKYEGDKETQDEGRKFVGALFVSALASYTFNNFNKATLEGLVVPALNYLPYAGAALKIFIPTKLESLVILSTTIYRTYLSIKRGSSQGLAGLAISSGMEIMNQNPITVAIAVALGVGAIAAHNAIETSEAKRTLLMKVFVKNFLDQAATDELVKENPEKIIMAVFEAIQTAGNPVRLIYHLYAMFYKGWSAAEIADKTAGRNIFVLTIFEGLEMLGLDKDSKWRNLSGNYLFEALSNLIKRLSKSVKKTTLDLIRCLLPAPLSCRTFTFDNRIGWPTMDCDMFEVNCPCGYYRQGRKNDMSVLHWEILRESGPSYCLNRGPRALSNPLITKFFKQGIEVQPVVKREGVGEILIKGVTVRVNFSTNVLIATDEWAVPSQVITKIDGPCQGIGYQEAYLGTKPKYQSLIERKCATIDETGVKFIKCKRGMAYTENLDISNLKTLIEVVKKNKIAEGDIPEKIEGPTWVNYALVNEDVGGIRPSFGEIILPEAYEEDPIFPPDVTIDTNGLDIPSVGINSQNSTSGVTFNVTTKLKEVIETGKKIVKMGFNKGEFPGPFKNESTLNEQIEESSDKPFIYICGSSKSMSNRVKSARNIRRLDTKSPRLFRDLARQGKLIIVVLGDKYHDTIYKHADFKGTFLSRETLGALSWAKPVTKHMSRKEAEVILHKELAPDLELPEWLHSEEPKFLDVVKGVEEYHLVGGMAELKTDASKLGATASTKITKSGNTYMVKLSTWWESERIATLDPLFKELLFKCKPCQKRDFSSCHFVSAPQLARGGWKPIAPAVHYGEVPAKKEKIPPYEAYLVLKGLVENLDHQLPEIHKDKHRWILKKIKINSRLGLKHLVSPGSIGEGMDRTKRKTNIYNKIITTTMTSIGIKPEKLPVVRAQTSTVSFHQSIREKIDKKPNEQLSDLHDNLWDIFQSVCAKSELRETFGEVDWDTLTKGINRKGAAGFFEKKNVGEIIDTDRKSVEKLIKNIKKGEPVHYYETAIPKNEKRDVTADWLESDYIDEKKPRVIQYPEAQMRLAITKMMYKWVKQKPTVIPGYEGKTPLFKVFDKVHDEWKQFQNPVAVSFDTKAWDTQVTPRDLELIAKVQKYYFKKSCHTFIDNLTEEMKEVPVVCEDGEVYIRVGQRGSGQPDTSAGNSMLNVLTMIFAFCKANEIPFKVFPRVAKIHVCGDDGFLITERKLGETFSRVGPQILHEAGKPQKLVDEHGLKLAYKFQDIEFCSHTPIQVRWDDGTSSYLPGRDTATILAKMATRLDSSGERGSQEYERAVAFSFLLMYSWNPLVRRLCLLVLSILGTADPAKSSTMFTYKGDPIGAYQQVIGKRLSQMKQTEFQKLAACNLSMSLLGIYSKHTTKRLIEDCVKMGKLNKQIPVNADRLISKHTGLVYEHNTGWVQIGRHYEELDIREPRKRLLPTGTERYIPGPIRTFILKRLKILEVIGLKFF